jgi:hypothetical protein
MSAKLTPWFPADVKPVHVGVYQREDCDTGRPYYYFWNGDFFEFGGRSAPEDVKRNDWPTISEGERWRGLADEPGVTP